MASVATGYHADILQGLNAVARLTATEAAGSLVAPGGLVDKLSGLMVAVLEKLVDSGNGRCTALPPAPLARCVLVCARCENSRLFLSACRSPSVGHASRQCICMQARDMLELISRLDTHSL